MNGSRAAFLLMALILAGCDIRGELKTRSGEDSEPALGVPSGLGTSGIPPKTYPPAPGTATAAAPAGAPSSFAELAANSDPGVVFVRVVQAKQIGFRRVLQDGNGSGFVFDPEGLILTNYHVVQAADAISVEFFDGRKFPAQIVGADPLTDVAVLRVQAKGLKALPLGDSDAIRVGDWVLAIGNPYGLSHTVSAGIISAKERTGHDVELNNPRAYYSFLQTDASINPGNSGGPLLDTAGRVIGINTAINPDANSIGFAIPINMVRELLPRLLSDGLIQRAAIGVQVGPLPELSNPPPERRGAFVANVIAGGPADAAGLEAGDIIVELGDHSVDGPERLRWWASLAAVGQKTKLTIYRGTEKRVLEVVPVRLESR